ncbi:hypothetical protein UFOVP167_46 [uncultured Caudovirales phage]|uniref:Uncharacterized protein n=1 Tax=uncultured Caudovirales phage TaxID=2100421 RepID=A0A6J7WCQ9_9CAUD|nr:hypothetical protein UFOVP167_46 [uncultured Caudovirales phage]
MALGFSTEASTGGSKFLPVVKFDAKSGDMICINREPGQKPGEWEKTEAEVELPTKVVIDFENMEVGWISFAPTYSAVMVKVGNPFPAQPTPDHKQAIRAKVFFKEHGLREFSPTSKMVLRVIDNLHNDYLAAADKNAGKMPVVSINGTKPVKITTPQGELRFKVPDMVISGWTEAPAAFSGAAEAPVEQPKAKPAKPVQADDFEDF